MRRKKVDEQHMDAHLMGSEVKQNDGTYKVVGLQSRWATIARPDGFRRTVGISDIEDDGRS